MSAQHTIAQQQAERRAAKYREAVIKPALTTATEALVGDNAVLVNVALKLLRGLQ